MDAFVGELRNTFETAMANLMNALSEPNGNGKAYDKFLAIYHSIQNGGALLPTKDQAA